MFQLLHRFLLSRAYLAQSRLFCPKPSEDPRPIGCHHLPKATTMVQLIEFTLSRKAADATGNVNFQKI